MPDLIVVETASGGKLYFGPPQAAGLREVGTGAPVKATEGEFENAIGMIGELVALLDKSVGALVKRPSKVEMEFGASLSGKTSLWVVSGEGKAEFKVKLVWEGETKPKT